MMSSADFVAIKNDGFDHVRFALDPYCFGARSNPLITNAGYLTLWDEATPLDIKYKGCFNALKQDIPDFGGGGADPEMVFIGDWPIGGQPSRNRWLYDVRKAVVDQLRSLNSVISPVDPQGNITGPPVYNYEYNSGLCVYNYHGQHMGTYQGDMWGNNFDERWHQNPRIIEASTQSALFGTVRP